MARILPLRIVHATDNKRPPFVRPTERYRSSSSIRSKAKSIGSLFSTCSNSVGATLWAARCFLFSSSQSNSIPLATPLDCIATYIRSRLARHERCEAAANLWDLNPQYVRLGKLRPSGLHGGLADVAALHRSEAGSESPYLRLGYEPMTIVKTKPELQAVSEAAVMEALADTNPQNPVAMEVARMVASYAVNFQRHVERSGSFPSDILRVKGEYPIEEVAMRLTSESIVAS